jgi:hypothetical protein
MASEDDIVQISERTAVAGSPSFTRALVLAFVRAQNSPVMFLGGSSFGKR